jgi:hypothetical protein
LKLQVDKFRFHIVDELDRARSSSWFVSSRGDDVYLSPRSTGSSLKLSIHRDGNCQYGTTAHYLKHARSLGLNQFPPLLRWRRPTTPGKGGAAVATILFPTDFLHRVDVPLKKGPKFSIPMAPPGHAIEVLLVYSREAVSVTEAGLLALGITPIVHVCLPGGDNVNIGARSVKFDPKYIPELSQRRGRIVPLTGAPKPGESIDGAHAVLVLKHPEDGEAIHLFEVNGLSVYG